MSIIRSKRTLKCKKELNRYLDTLSEIAKSEYCFENISNGMLEVLEYEMKNVMNSMKQGYVLWEEGR